jgi:hypothetical protein
MWSVSQVRVMRMAAWQATCAQALRSAAEE